MKAELRAVLEGEPLDPVKIHPGERFLVGRTLDAQLNLPDSAVSRTHASLALISNRLYITDLASRHGTILNDESLTANMPALVLPGSRIRIGPCTIDVDISRSNEGEEEWVDYQLERAKLIIPPDKYIVLGKLGGGSLGRVWAAKRLSDDLPVAIKVIRVELEPNSEAHQRFLRESRLISDLDSPHVVRFLGAGAEQGRPYLVTELVHGPSVKDRLTQDPFLSVPESLRIGCGVAIALNATHEAGIVHRDVKPQNILLSPSGQAKLNDFGVAKSLKRQEGEFMTETGWSLGTPAYLAPEQNEDAKVVDSRADLYSLGATLYHLIGGRPPLINDDCDTSLDIKDMLAGEPRPLRDLRPDCPGQVASLVHGLLKRDPDARVQPAARVAEELSSLLHTLYQVTEDLDTASKGWKLPSS